MSTKDRQQADNGSNATPSQGNGARSTIAFPYSALDAAIKLATVIYEGHGNECDLAQLAGGLNTTVTSSKFRSMVSAAKMFNLIHTRAEGAVLTELGISIVDPSTSDDAKVEAFLSVPLYRAVHDRFAGRVLPPDPGLEAAIRSLGVTAKSVARARQTLQRSAATAGFFQSGKNRLLRPPKGQLETTAPPPTSRDDETAGELESERPISPEAPGPSDRLLGALWSKLPTEGAFPEPQRSQWVKMMELALDMVYGPAAESIDDEPD